MGIDREPPIDLCRVLGAASINLLMFIASNPEFLEILETNARHLSLTEKISTLACSMDKLPFGDEEYDVIWSEGAIYNIGFEKGVKDWKRFLKNWWNAGRIGNYLANC